MVTVNWTRPAAGYDLKADQSKTFGFDLRDILSPEAANLFFYFSEAGFEVVANGVYGTGVNDAYRGPFQLQGAAIVGGTVNEFVRSNSRKIGTIGGLDVDYRALKAVALIVTKTDDMALWSQAFKSIDILRGSRGADRLEGFAGSDTLTGGGGGDRLSGGTGSDTFAFNMAIGSTVASGARDTILNFKHSERDKGDLKGIDANAKTAGNQAFTFIQDLDFTGRAGEPRYEAVESGAVVLWNRNGDGEPDFAIFMKALKSLVKSDFVL